MGCCATRYFHRGLPMALDVYAGPHTVYHAGQWENVVQAQARKRGQEYHQIRLRDESDALSDPEAIRRMIVEWRGDLSDALGDNLPGRLDWGEQTVEYMTAQPEHYVDFAEDPACRRSAPNSAMSGFPAIIRETEFWLPADFEFSFKAAGPNSDAVMFSSAHGLSRQLRLLNEMTWRADLRTIDLWSDEWPSASAPLEVLARYAFSDKFAIASYACAKGVPIKLDY